MTENSFCVALYEALYGARPYAGDDYADLRRRVLAGDRVAPPAGARVPRWLAAVLDRGLQPIPEERWPELRGLLTQLERDPERARRRVVAGLLVTGGLLAAGYGASTLRSQESPCSGIAARLEGVWSPARGESIAGAFAAAEPGYAAELGERVRDDLERYASRWVEGYEGACAAQQRGEVTERRYELTTACYADRRALLSATLDRLEQVDEELLERAAMMVAALPAISSCEERAILESRFAPPFDPALATEVARLQGRVAELRVLALSGKIKRASEGLRALAEPVRATGHLPLIAEFARALAGSMSIDESSARTQLEREALDAALRSGDDTLAAAQAIRLMRTARLKGQAGLAEQEVYGAFAWALIDRVGHRERALASRYYSEISAAAFLKGELEEAEALARAGHDLAMRAPDSDWVLQSRAKTWYADVLVARGQVEELAALAREAVELQREHQGARHPQIVETLNLSAMAAFNEGAPERAIELYDEALKIFAEITEGARPPYSLLHGRAVARDAAGDLEGALADFQRSRQELEANNSPERVMMLMVDNSIAVTLDRMGEHARAVEVLEPAVASLEELVGDHNPYAATVILSLADALLHAGELAEADAVYARAVELWRELDAENPMSSYALHGRGMVALAAGEHARAVELLERALQLREANGEPPATRAETRFALARALAGREPNDEQRARARSLALAAAADYEGAGAGHGDERAAITTWLEEQGSASTRRPRAR